MVMFHNLFKSIPIFEGLDLEELKAIEPLFKKRTYTRGTILFMEGDLGDECFVIDSGLVKIFRVDESREITLALLHEGDYFGEMAMIRKGMPRSATAEVIETGMLYTLSRTDFMYFLESNPIMCLKLLEETMERLRNANEQIYDLTFLDLKTRLHKVLVRMADEKGVPVDGGMMIPFKLTHQQLANMVGSIRESVSKMLIELQDEQLISVKNKQFTIYRR
ncbi:Crp/Fnr family transcriptional regulator [Paenibacillus xanthanilyticus]|uniref:Crp/Fnr family transcriptional regulator n=1 Tax=Paenibacillus xanthanilyticus TaxID=1783531 RepID=A0ABV8K8D7_9BACL